MSDIDQKWHKLANSYEIIKSIGKGTFGEVVKARNLTNNRVVAIKMIKQPFKDDY